MSPDWKTTVGGLILAVGQLLPLLPYGWAFEAGAVLSATGAAVLGKAAMGVRER